MMSQWSCSPAGSLGVGSNAPAQYPRRRFTCVGQWGIESPSYPMASVFRLSTLTFLFAAICLAQTVTLHAGLNNALSNAASTKAVSAQYSSRSSFAEDKEDVTLLDIVLVASVDGRFHALNRTSGQKLWSMSHSAHEAPSSLAPLVRTKHASYDSDLTDDDDAHHEVYMIEPQSGDIYVMATPSSKLQRLSFSMAQLVEMSPFKFARDDDERVFVGKKERNILIGNRTGDRESQGHHC